MIAGIISRISGPVVLSERMRGSKMYDVVKVGAEELNGEIIRLMVTRQLSRCMKIHPG